MYKDLEKRKERVRAFLKTHPKATFQDLRLVGKIERIYPGGMGEAFADAGVEPPRTFERKTREEKRKIIIEYIKEHPRVGGQKIYKDTKINLYSVFKRIENAFDAAGVKYSSFMSKHLREEKKRAVINFVKNNPLIGQVEIQNKLHVKIYRLFKNMNEIYKKAGIKPIGGHAKRTIKRQQEIIAFIKNNPKATQREINRQCKTHIQELFKGGIFEAYRQAGIKFPIERLQIHGVVKEEIRKRWQRYENMVATRLLHYGKVKRLVKTKRGCADIILEKGKKNIIIEVKDYKAHEISISQIKQINRYLEDCNYNLGILICSQKQKRDMFSIGDKKIFVMTTDEINTIPYLMNKYG